MIGFVALATGLLFLGLWLALLLAGIVDMIARGV